MITLEIEKQHSLACVIFNLHFLDIQMKLEWESVG